MTDQTKSGETILQFKDINFSYKNGPNILDNLNFEIKLGKIVAIAGPNGAGKTTLIKHLNGLLKPESGEIFHDGTLVENYKHLTAHVGIVFQNPDEQVFFPKVTDDIAFGLRNRGVSAEEVPEKVAEVMKKLRITKLKDRSFFNLSFGEKKKVAFAGVLITMPDVMVLDEPTIGLDPWSKDYFLDIIEEMREPTRTIICASHDFDLLERMDEIFLLWNGKISGPYNNLEEYREAMKTVEVDEE